VKWSGSFIALVPNATATLSPTQAVQALSEVQHYEESTTARTAGLIAMVWAIVIPLTILMQLQFDLYLFKRLPWLDLFLWLPPAAAATFLSSCLARDRAVRLGASFRSRDFWLGMAVFVGALFAEFGLVSFQKMAGLPVLDIGFAGFAGLYLMGRGVWLWRASWYRRPWSFAMGALLLSAGILYGILGFNAGDAEQWMTLVVAGTIGIAWFTHGLALYLRG